MRGESNKADWRKLVWSNYGAPKWKFIFFLALHRRLLTKVRLTKWERVESDTCPLCDQDLETIDHLFFVCPYISAIWMKLLAWQGINRHTMTWQNDVYSAIANVRGKNNAQIYHMTLAGSVYYYRQERNHRVLQGKSQNAEVIKKKIIQDVHGRGFLYPRLEKRLEELNMYP